jgi:polyphosphate kinase 2 (PPK2 family)
VSREEQRRRFLSRIDDQSKNWKFSEQDLDEARLWDDYMRAYEVALNETSRPAAPWYAIPADNKAYARACIADVLVKTLQALPLRFPELGEDDQRRMRALRDRLSSG